MRQSHASQLMLELMHVDIVRLVSTPYMLSQVGGLSGCLFFRVMWLLMNKSC